MPTADWKTTHRFFGSVPGESAFYQGKLDSMYLFGHDGSVRLDLKDLEKLYDYLGNEFSKDDEGVR